MLSPDEVARRLGYKRKATAVERAQDLHWSVWPEETAYNDLGNALGHQRLLTNKDAQANERCHGILDARADHERMWEFLQRLRLRNQERRDGTDERR